MRWPQIIVFLWSTITLSVVSGGVSYLRGGNYQSSFDYQTYYEQTYPVQRTQSLTSNGVDLRQSGTPFSVQDQIAMSGFDSVSCNVRTRTWQVVFTNALSDIVFGETTLTALGNCYVSNSGQPTYDLIEADKYDYTDDITGAIVTVVTFILNNPNVNQNVLSCTFQLFTTALQPVQPPTLFQVYSHLCNRKSRLAPVDDGNGNLTTPDTGSGCGHADLFCFFDADEFRGTAIFWDFIIGLEVALLIFLLITKKGLEWEESRKMYTDISQYASSRRSGAYAEDDSLKMRIESMDDNELENLLHKVHNGQGVMGNGNHMQYSQYTTPLQPHATNTDHFNAIMGNILGDGQKRMDYPVPVDEYTDKHRGKQKIRWSTGVDENRHLHNEPAWETDHNSHNIRPWSGLTSNPYAGSETDDE
jgi:hypothetical protein